MADPVQWTVDQFWQQVQNLQGQIINADTALKADAASLGQLYSTAAANYDPSRDVWIAPLIHRNNEIRLNYLGPVKDKFNQAVAAARAVLQGAGYTVPNALAGLGDPFVVPTIAIAAVVLALAAVLIVNRVTAAQIQRTAQLSSIYGSSLSFDQKQAAAQMILDQTKAEANATPPPLGFDLKSLIPLAAIAAVILLGPQILRMIAPTRRAVR
jgi:hypothetical protein